MAAFNNYPQYGAGQMFSPQAQLAQLTTQLANLQNSFAASQPIVQPVIGPPAGDSLVRLNGMEGVNQYMRLMKPNSRAAGFDENDDILYIMQTDSSNYPSVRKFRFTEILDAESVSPEYVTLEEFNKFKEDLLNAKQFVQQPSEAVGSQQGYRVQDGGSKADDRIYQNNEKSTGRDAVIT